MSKQISLNKEQQEAVDLVDGPTMILAGPGTGKTQLLASRIASILQKTDINPSNILAITFTEIGATELKERVIKAIGTAGYQINITTFHSLSFEIIRLFPQLFEVSDNESSINELDKHLLIKEILNELKIEKLKPIKNINYHIKSIIKKIKEAKLELISPKMLFEHLDQPFQVAKSKTQQKKDEQSRLKLTEFARIYEAYQDRLIKTKRFDFEDMIFLAIDALKNDPEVKFYFQEKYQYILVDEYQDTNNAQNTLIETIADYFEQPNLCVVGDDKQAIYRFQGASVANMIHFYKKYSQIKIIQLKENYRSDPYILEMAEALISNNKKQIDSYLPNYNLKLNPNNPREFMPKFIKYQNIYAEYEGIVEEIKKRLSEKIKPEQIAILCRNNSQTIEIHRYLQKSGLKSSVEANLDLTTTPIIRRVVTTLYAILKLEDSHLFPLIQVLIEPSKLPKFYDIWKGRKKPILEELVDSNDPNFISVNNQIVTWHKNTFNCQTSKIIESVFFLSETLKKLSPTIEDYQALIIFKQLAESFDRANKLANLDGFLNYFTELSDNNIKVELPVFSVKKNAISVITVHKAKGCEFDTVFIPGLNEKNWKITSKQDSITLPAELIGLNNWQEDPQEDQRRVFYVAITRAKKRLFCSYSELDQDGKPILPSSLITEVLDKTEQITAQTSELPTIHNDNYLVDKKELNEDALSWIRQRIESKAFSYSDLTDYLSCPRSYLLSRVFNLSSASTNISLIYGTAVHSALDRYHKEKIAGTKIDKDKFLAIFSLQMKNALGPKTEISRQTVVGLEVLSKFYDEILSKSPKPIASEYNFANKLLKTKSGIWVTGKVDLIEPIENSSYLRAIDFKTGTDTKSRAAISGETKAQNSEILNQLTFYSILFDLDKNSTYKISEYAIQFIDDNGRFAQLIFSISSDQRLELLKTIENTYQQIINDKQFLHIGSYDQKCELCRLEIY